MLEENESAKIIYKGYTIKEELYNAYSQIIHYGKEDPMVSRAILNGLYLVYMASEKSVKSQIKEFMDYVYDICINSVQYDMDKEGLNIIYRDFNINRDDQSDYDAIREDD